jgi:hypothetical protein
MLLEHDSRGLSRSSKWFGCWRVSGIRMKPMQPTARQNNVLTGMNCQACSEASISREQAVGLQALQLLI